MLFLSASVGLHKVPATAGEKEHCVSSGVNITSGKEQ